MIEQEQERVFKYLKSLNGDINVYQGAMIEILNDYSIAPDEQTLKRILNKHKSRVRRERRKRQGYSEYKKEYVRKVIYVNNFEQETRM